MSLRSVDVNFRVRCNHEDGGKCSEVAKSIRDTYNNIIQIKITKPVGEHREDICIIGTAKIHSNNTSKFQKSLKSMKITNKNTVIKKVEVEILQ